MKMGRALKKTDFLEMRVANDFEYHWPEVAYISVDANGNVTSINIEVFYNRQRRQKWLGYLSPAAYEKQFYEKRIAA